MVSRNGRDGQNSILHTEILSVFFSHLQVLIAFHEIFIRPSECCVRKLPSPCHQWCQLATAGAHSSWKLGRGAPLYTGMDIGRVTFDHPFVRTGNEKEDDEKHVCLRYRHSKARSKVDEKVGEAKRQFPNHSQGKKYVLA